MAMGVRWLRESLNRTRHLPGAPTDSDEKAGLAPRRPSHQELHPERENWNERK